MENTIVVNSKELVDFTLEYAEMLGVSLTPDSVSVDGMELSS